VPAIPIHAAAPKIWTNQPAMRVKPPAPASADGLKRAADRNASVPLAVNG
jgi:hypothetical protein